VNLEGRFPRASASTRALNPGLFGAAGTPTPAVEEGSPRMRQNRGPKLNKTEAAFAAWLGAQFPDLQVEREGVTLLLANGVRYTADFAVFNPAGDLVLYETKGKKFWDDAIVKLKVAALRYPKIAFWLTSPADRTLSTWKLERVFP
jgi:hypothetical protein